MKIAVISGGFDPLHSGHISYINAASSFGEKTIILLNSDNWLRNKKGKEFMPFQERKTVLEAMKHVDSVISFEDDDGSCIKGLESIKEMYPDDHIIFCNGGDRNSGNIPEMEVKDIEFCFGVGGSDKKNSSSWILKSWKYPSEIRVWGSFLNLFEDKNVKVKELIIDSNKGISFQRHMKRNEIWFISEGECYVNFSKKDPHEFQTIHLPLNSTFTVEALQWHQIFNTSDSPCKIIEIQYGEETKENDIERLCLYPETP